MNEFERLANALKSDKAEATDIYADVEDFPLSIEGTLTQKGEHLLLDLSFKLQDETKSYVTKYVHSEDTLAAKLPEVKERIQKVLAKYLKDQAKDFKALMSSYGLEEQ